MTLLDTFVTKTETLEQSLALIQQESIPDSFSKDFLKNIGFVLPNSVHYVSLFKGLGLIDKELQPLNHYRLFAESAVQARVVIADRMREAYAPIFETESHAHKLPKGQIYDLFKKVMGPEKSGTFIHMVADTFIALADYADWKTTTTISPREQTLSEGEQEQLSEKKKRSEHHAIEVDYTPHVEFITELMNGNTEHHYQYEHPVTVAENGNGPDSYHEIHPGIIEQSEFDKKTDGTANSLTPHEEFILELMNSNSDHEYRTEIISLAEKHNEEIILLNNVKKEHSHSGQFSSSITTVKDIKADRDGFPEEKDANGGQQPSTEKTLLIKDVLFKRAELLIKLQQYESAVSAYDDIILFANKDHSIDKEKVLEVMYRKAAILEQTAKYEEAIAAYDQLIALG